MLAKTFAAAVHGVDARTTSGSLGYFMYQRMSQIATTSKKLDHEK